MGAKEGEKTDRFSLLAAPTLIEQAEALKAQADDEDERARRLHEGDLEHRVGMALRTNEQNLTVDFLSGWDKNGKVRAAPRGPGGREQA